MHGVFFSLLPEGFVFPNAQQCFVWAAPVLALAVLWWLVDRTDRIVGHLFPDLEWEKSLGWLNIKAERRANTALRWVGYGFYVLLIDALVGIVWAAEGLPELDNWSDPWVMGDLALRVPALFFCLGIWVLYLGCWLMPKLRAQREATAWKRLRAETEETEMERGMQPSSRISSPLQKPRTNAPLISIAPDRTKGRRHPGG
jgi:hypothetical protein